jgi:hypothetical protein
MLVLLWDVFLQLILGLRLLYGASAAQLSDVCSRVPYFLLELYQTLAAVLLMPLLALVNNIDMAFHAS